MNACVELPADCYFCGAKVKVYDVKTDIPPFSVYCPKCGAEGPKAASHGEAVSKWNKLETAAISMIRDERKKQLERYSLEHDRESNDNEQLVYAATSYLVPIYGNTPYLSSKPPLNWPWGEDDWKPDGNRIRNLVKAASLIVAEIDRLALKGGNND